MQSFTVEIRIYQVGCTNVTQHQVMCLGQQVLLLPESIDDHEVEEDTDQGQGHVRGDHDESIHHPIRQVPRCQ